MSTSAGRVLLIPKGEYNASTTYQMLDLVSYEGSSYVCKQTSTGNLPTDTTYWQLIAQSAAYDISSSTESGNPVSFTTDSSGISKDTIVTLEPIQSGSGDPSPTNVRPISGYNEIEVNGCGKNLIPMTVSGIKSANTSGTWSGDAYTLDGVTLTILSDADGNVTGIKANGTASKTNKFQLHGNFLPDFGGKSITLNGCPSGGSYSSGYSLHIYNVSTQNTLARDEGSGATVTPRRGYDYACAILFRGGTVVNNLTFYPMIRLATETDPTFAPYTGHRITSTLPSTIYGGTYDVETGELTVDRALVDLGSLTWSTYSTDNKIFYSMIGAKPSSALKCSALKPVSGVAPATLNNYEITVYSNGTIYARDTDVISPETFKTAMSGVQLAYELATPYTISLEPHLLNLFEGQNNVSTNGTQISVTYRNGIVARVDDFNAVGESFEALTGKVEAVEIDKAESSALAPVENGAIASRAYAVGEHFYRDGAFCTAKTSIASGATFTLGTNYTAGTVADIIPNDQLYRDNYTTVTANAWEYTGVSFTLDTPAIVWAKAEYNSAIPLGIAINDSSIYFSQSDLLASNDLNVSKTVTGFLESGTFYVWVKYKETGTNHITIRKLIQL